ncbi:MAG: hypothetical protein H6834_08595 [Planctomycetes bacterium]|nr:hypothetical protein [Planctomycetota bacterium]
MDDFGNTDPRLAAGDSLDQPHRLLMELYWEPLQRYYERSTFHPRAGDPADVINGFLTWYAEKEYLLGWQPDRQRLRYYLVNGLKKYLLQESRARKRDRLEELPEDGLPVEASNTTEYDREYVRSFVLQAVRQGEEACAARDLASHWEIFYEHLFEGRGYREIAASRGLTAPRCEVMAKAGLRRFREAISDLLTAEGIALGDHQHEIDLYIEILQS